MEMQKIVGYGGLPSNEKLDARLCIVKYVSVLKWSLNKYLNEIHTTYNEILMKQNTYEILKLSTGKKF